MSCCFSRLDFPRRLLLAFRHRDPPSNSSSPEAYSQELPLYDSLWKTPPEAIHPPQAPPKSAYSAPVISFTSPTAAPCTQAENTGIITRAFQNPFLPFALIPSTRQSFLAPRISLKPCRTHPHKISRTPAVAETVLILIQHTFPASRKQAHKQQNTSPSKTKVPRRASPSEHFLKQAPTCQTLGPPRGYRTDIEKTPNPIQGSGSQDPV